MQSIKAWIGASRRLPDDVLGELVELIFGSIVSILVVGTTILAVGVLVALRHSDLFIAALGVVGFLAALARAALIVAYRRRTSHRALSRQEATRWEQRYWFGSCASALALGLLCVRVLAVGDALSHMLLTGLLFSYGSGVISRTAVRPVIACTALLLAGLPAVGAFAVKAAAENGQMAIVYAAQATLIVAMLMNGLEVLGQTYRDTVSQLQTKRNFARMAREDPLTGLPNRLLLRERFDADVARADRALEWVALHFLDLDRFKAVNDQFGHPVGDQLLCLVAERLNATLRAGDTAARLGGDEFVVVQTGIRRREEAALLAGRIVETISAPYQIDGHELSIGTSIGIALAPQDGLDLEQLALCADAALYQAKNRRRGSIAFWADASGEPSARSLDVSQRVHA